MTAQTRGGKREGAGRKPNEIKSVLINLYIEPDLIEEMERMVGKGKRSQFIKDAIREKIAAAKEQ